MGKPYKAIEELGNIHLIRVLIIIPKSKQNYLIPFYTIK
jgi:hypothetical protein